jgi:hypothetical protein
MLHILCIFFLQMEHASFGINDIDQNHGEGCLAVVTTSSVLLTIVGFAVALNACQGSLDRIDIHGRPCAAFERVSDRLGGIADAQAYVDANGHITDKVCYQGETKEGAIWYTTGN